MKFFNKTIATTLVAAQFGMAVPAFSAETDAGSVEAAAALEATQQAADAFNAQMQAVRDMTDEQLRAEMENQAAQIELSITQAELSGITVNQSEKDELQALAASIREEAAKPHLKRHLFGRKLMAIPRAIVQGLGIIGLAMADVVFIPVIFLSSFSFHLGAGNGKYQGSDVAEGIKLGMGIGLGTLTGGAVMTTQMLVMGYAFPVVIAAIIPPIFTINLVCKHLEIKSPHTQRFCDRVVGGNDDMLDAVWHAGETSGGAIHNFVTHPFKTLGLRKNTHKRMKSHF